MAYSNNPHLPRVRMQAVLLVRHRGGACVRFARHTGFHHTAIMKWIKKAPNDGRKTIPTKSSRPHSHSRMLAKDKIDSIINQRKKRNRCSEVVHQELLNKGVVVSLSSVKRTLKRNYLLRERSPWKRWHWSFPRPEAEKTGDLVQMDTIHIMVGNRRF